MKWLFGYEIDKFNIRFRGFLYKEDENSPIEHTTYIPIDKLSKILSIMRRGNFELKNEKAILVKSRGDWLIVKEKDGVYLTPSRIKLKKQYKDNEIPYPKFHVEEIAKQYEKAQEESESKLIRYSVKCPFCGHEENITDKSNKKKCSACNEEFYLDAVDK
jgi:NADH pyrophosphatase NudC (nudix superfamily)